jgi:phage gpG-like protein
MVSRVTTSGGLNIDSGLLQFIFTPTIGMSARGFDKLGLDIRSFRVPLTRAIQKVIAPSFGENFVAGGRPDSWEALSEETISRKRRLGYDDTILVRTGLLQRTIQQLNIWSMSTTNATIKGLPDKIGYGVVHQDGYSSGGSFGAFKSSMQKSDPGISMHEILSAVQAKGASASVGVAEIPARPFVVLQEEDYPKVDRVFADWMDERIIARLGL